MSRPVAWLGALVGVAVGASAATAEVRPPLSSIQVDVGPLREKGLGPYAETVRAVLSRELSVAYADRDVLRGGRLVVRVDGISLSAYAGQTGPRPFGSGVSSDYLEGEALLVGPRGEILERHPQLSALPSNSGRAWYGPGFEERRLAALAAHYAGWLRRSFP